ncbi:MAG TPA: glutathione S-transferase family protein [Beijerinckiaceae bacterium]|nr:glutathione S-transferase family protein [Beijerinckiaceae bacterium]
MLTIYGVYRSRAARNIWLANELGVPFKHVPVIQVNRLPNPNAADAPLHTKSPAFLKVNPNGHVPCIDDNGLVLCESMAINLYLARKHGGPLAPANIAEEGLMTQWSFWAACEMDPLVIQSLYNRVMKPEAERDLKAAEMAEAALKVPLKVLNRYVGASDYLVGGRFTVADLNVSEVVRTMTVSAPQLLDDVPNVKAWLATCHARPHFKAMMEIRNAE